MSEETNLELDMEARESGEVARVCLVMACSYVKGGGAPTITEDCRSYPELEAEVDRLKAELDEILRSARARFAGSEREAAEPERRAERAEAAPADAMKAHLPTELCVRDLMTQEVKTLERNDTLSVADELMKLGRFRHVVVVDEDGRLAGVVSQRDIFYGALAWSLGQGRTGHEKALQSYPVKSVMRSDVVTVRPEVPLAQAADLMMERKIGCLPVMEGDKLIGILTEGDFLAMLAERAV